MTKATTGVTDSSTRIVETTKSVRFSYQPTSQIRELLESFRAMVNDAIRICLTENLRGRLRLRDRIYKEFQARYGVVSRYPYTVAEVAWSIVKKHFKWKRRPVARHLFLKMDAENYSLNHSILSLPFKKNSRILIPLEYGDYQRTFLIDGTLRRGSVTITELAVFITFTKETAQQMPQGRVGVDLNSKSVVTSSGSRYDLSEINRLHAEYGVRRRNFSARHPGDRRLARKFSEFSREKNRVRQILHNVASAIVGEAKSENQCIVLENLAGVGTRHRNRNPKGKSSRRRISQWPFRLLQDFMAYKAGWEGIPLEYVNAAHTSQTCSVCNSINRELKLTEREWRCPRCGAILDRDLNAAINIQCRGKIGCLGEVRPGAQGKDEAVKGNPTTPVILRAEALKSSGLVDERPI